MEIKGMKNNSNEIEYEQLPMHIGEKVWIHGSIYKIRKMKGFSFVLLRTKRNIIQCIASEEVEIPQEESCVSVYANVVKEERSKTGWELHMEAVKVLSSSKEISPIAPRLLESSVVPSFKTTTGTRLFAVSAHSSKCFAKRSLVTT